MLFSPVIPFYPELTSEINVVDSTAIAFVKLAEELPPNHVVTADQCANLALSCISAVKKHLILIDFVSRPSSHYPNELIVKWGTFTGIRDRYFDPTLPRLNGCSLPRRIGRYRSC